jgi:hypothetical protein
MQRGLDDERRMMNARRVALAGVMVVLMAGQVR